MLNTSKTKSYRLWEAKQDALIASITSQPLIVLIRISEEDLERLSTASIVDLINTLNYSGIRNIEIAWSEHPNWILFIKEIRNQFREISFGVASINNTKALEVIKDLGFSFAMSPCWNEELQYKSRELGQLVIPGLFSPTEIQHAFTWGFRVIKLFPASILGIDYLKHLKNTLTPLPLIIAAGGMEIKDIKPWISEGYNAIVLGKSLIENNHIDPTFASSIKAVFK
ncbi:MULTISPECIES: bifunctional 4-hydroxy-2-oxoglutarate aldolase/2-dehydro-3-deoxy-phosphogluconate aldolase [unclassified Prochlorococcus]|uniref:bifunctional 4-hydroxy-2-oxoglutarate aldolase/2-dehydro-3-deoxy-phosphogluconate aldolase n=1 Tax=unclassified Prochlorococcus TaxID=2627481 RepID=UPI0005339931|nr:MULTISPECIES: bifunctional 4-hydroxy-2-oxoglutarate aldolase/2-dehydro-3-deoxy-phosphogluconate aldolase [unclassified Prochlorococcus]KGG16708.1 putative aldolase [Prochlorococcus sp. MIT 0602]KGG18320.1 putative aldolase [Prochlorococcus sp. MIT 0603]